ncbi:MAG: alpha/beta hydrolase [Oligoflexia bacterium]|nr:alpha/beta hydrolase [Oligoflexia bacterium]
MGAPPHLVILHGTMGSPQSNWFPWLAQQAALLGCRVSCPQLPTPKDQNLFSWLETFQLKVGELKKEMILVGHSAGATFSLRLLERSSTKIKGAAIVSGFPHPLGIPEFDPLLESFVDAPFDWSKIRHHCAQIAVINGDNDPYVPLEMGQEIADHLGVPLQTVPNGGHLNADAGYLEFPLLGEWVKRSLNAAV